MLPWLPGSITRVSGGEVLPWLPGSITRVSGLGVLPSLLVVRISENQFANASDTVILKVVLV